MDLGQIMADKRENKAKKKIPLLECLLSLFIVIPTLGVEEKTAPEGIIDPFLRGR